MQHVNELYNSDDKPEAAFEKKEAGRTYITERMVTLLKGAAPWIHFIAVLGFISAIITVFSGFYLVAVPLDDMGMMSTYAYLNMGMGMEALGTATGVFFIISGVMVFFPSLFAYRFAKKIRLFVNKGAQSDLEDALQNNKALWKFYGILCIAALAFSVFFMLIAIAAALILL